MKRINNLLILITFLLVSILSTLILAKTNVLYGAGDMQFHLKRIMELRASFSHGVWFPKYSFNYFHGSSVLTMYPYINVIPLVIITFFVHSFVNAVYIYFATQIFVSLIVSFFGSLSISKNKKISFVFSIIYSTSVMLLTFSFYNMDFGAVTAIVFLPMILFGTLDVLFHDEGVAKLSFGMIMIIYSHVLSVFISVLLILILAIVYYKKITKLKIYSFLKSAFITLLATFIVWGNALNLLIFNYKNIATPGRMSLSGQPFLFIIRNALMNNINYCFNIFCILSVIIFALNYKNIRLKDRKLYFVAIFFVFLCSSWFPWKLTNFSIFKAFQIFQFTWRLYVIPDLILIFLFSTYIVKISEKHNLGIIVIGFVILSMFLQLNGQYKLIHLNESSPYFNSEYVENNKKSGMVYIQYKNNPRYPLYRLKNNDISTFTTTFTDEATPDYFPKSVYEKNLSINNDDIFINKSKSKNMLHKVSYNTYLFSINKYADTLKLPILAYNHENISVYLDQKKISYINDDGIMMIRNVSRGKHILYVKENTNYYYDILSAILAVGTLLFLLITSLGYKLDLFKKFND